MSLLLATAEFIAMLFGGIFLLVMLTYVIQAMMWLMDKSFTGMYYVLLLVGGVVMYARIGTEVVLAWSWGSAVRGWRALGKSGKS